MSQRAASRAGNGYVSPMFVDASAWFGLGSSRDQHHRAASTLLTDLLSRPVPVITTNWTVYEALSMLNGRNGIESAEKLWRLVAHPASVELVYVTGAV